MIQPHFKYIHDLENQYFSTFFKHPELFNKYYVKESIFSQDFIGRLMKIVENLYHDKKAVTISNVYSEAQKSKLAIEYESLNILLQTFKPINLDSVESTIKIIRLNTARIGLSDIGGEALSDSDDITKDINESVLEASDKLDKLQEDLSISGDDFDDILQSIIADTKSIALGKQTLIFKTGHKEIDKKIPIVEDTIILVGGPAKHGKSKFVQFIVNALLENNPDTFATKWYSFEENSKELTRKFISSDTLLRDSELTGKERVLSDDDVAKVIKSTKKLKSFDIKIEDKPKSIQQVKSEFTIFAKKNSDKVPILIIDNLLLLDNKKNGERDDLIMNTINHIKQKTNGIIIIVHHFNDEQQKDEKVVKAFRPQLINLKGQESYRRVPKVILLINYPYKYDEIKNKYKNEKDILKHIWICDVAAIRDMPEIEVEHKSSTEANLIHFYTELDYNIFVPLSSLY